VGCCNELSEDPTIPSEPVKSTTGITVGDVFQTMNRARRARRLYAYASADAHDGDGFSTRFRVIVAGTVQLRPDDAYLLDLRERRHQEQVEVTTRRGAKRSMKDYRVAKL